MRADLEQTAKAMLYAAIPSILGPDFRFGGRLRYVLSLAAHGANDDELEWLISDHTARSASIHLAVLWPLESIDHLLPTVRTIKG